MGANLKKAVQLYKQYKTTSPEYRAIAAQMGFTSGDLNAYINRLLWSRR
jgi:hypothetical protein